MTKLEKLKNFLLRIEPVKTTILGQEVVVVTRYAWDKMINILIKENNDE